MFWKQCRLKYGTPAIGDADIQGYLKCRSKIQSHGYRGMLGWIQDMGHKYVAEQTLCGSTLEIGFGKGRQSLFFKGDPNNYYPIDVDGEYVTPETWSKFKNAALVSADSLPYPDKFFDHVVSLFVLEHISHLENVFKEIKRVMKPSGRLIVALPCEGGLAWNIGRELTTRRMFQKQYNINYDKVIAYEHKHCLRDLQVYLERHFQVLKSRYYPFCVPLIDANLVYCAVYSHP